RERGGAEAPPACPPPPAPPADEPSVGSTAHASGECRPCAYFHRPGGCLNGAECRHCHICPGGELKARKKDKLASLRGREAPPGGGAAPPAPLPTLLLSPLRPAPPSAGAASLAPVLNAGSVLHGFGCCKPCAFLWKPSGCGKGQACQHCHLCPAGELQARRRARQALLRLAGGGPDLPPPRAPALAAAAVRVELARLARALAAPSGPELTSAPLPEKLPPPAFLAPPAA
ncbi:unnamed protein product, partial [Prorocentrum cordatum]